MDYEMIDRIMAQKSLTADPAFEKLTVSIEPTPNLDGCPLGLYYPDSATVILPPDGTQGALLHELGHRHGHFYYDDLSESYAEHFRRIYQPKGRALLYRGNNFSTFPRFGALFEEGEKGTVEIALLQPLTPDGLLQLKSQLYSYQCECIECGYQMELGVHCSDIQCPVCGGQMRRAERPGPGQPRVYYGNSEIPWVRFEFTKGADWMVIIGASMAASVLVTVGVLGYAVYKVSEELPWVIPVSLLGTGMFFLLRAMTKEVKARVPAKARS